MTSMRKRGASGNDDDDDVESSAFVSDASLSKSKPMILAAKKKDQYQIPFQVIAVVSVVIVVFILTFNGTMNGKLLVVISSFEQQNPKRSSYLSMSLRPCFNFVSGFAALLLSFCCVERPNCL